MTALTGIAPAHGGAARAVAPAAGRSLPGLLAAGVGLVVALLPLALGGDRPLAWTLLAAWVFALAALYLAGVASGRLAPRLAAGALALPGALAGAFVLAAVAQCLPLSGAAPVSLAPGATGLAALRWGACAVFFGLAFRVAARPARARRLETLVLAAVTAQAALALAALWLWGGVIFPVQEAGVPGAARGSFVNRNALATFLGLGLALGAARLGAPGATPAVRIARLAALALIGAALVATGSRLGLAAAAAGLVVLALLAPARAARRVAVVAAIAGLTGALAVAGAGERLPLLAADAALRLELYRQAAELVAARPLTGWGLDSFAIAFEAVHRPALDTARVWDRAHSLPLSLWAEMGLVAGSLPMLACAAIGGRILRARRGRQALPRRARAALAALAVAGVHGAGDFGLEVAGNVVLLLAILALGLRAALARPAA